MLFFSTGSLLLALPSVLAFSGQFESRSAQMTVFSTFPNLTVCVSEVPTYSCENTTTISNTCCSPTPGGLVLQTQFWDTYTGLEPEQLLPKGSWTIHGLWPDDCDGQVPYVSDSSCSAFNLVFRGFEDQQYCDLSRQYDPAPSPSTLPDGTVVTPYIGPDVGTFIQDFGRQDLLDYMNTYWVSQGQANAAFWGHEFSKHGTCTSTFDVACYGSTYTEHAEVINFFDTVIRAFTQYPTWQMLASAGIVPSNQTGYTIDQIENTLMAQTGALPFLGCTDGTILSEVWYYHHVFGTEQYGRFKAINTTSPTTCSSNETIWYYERTPSSERDVNA